MALTRNNIWIKEQIKSNTKNKYFEKSKLKLNKVKVILRISLNATTTNYYEILSVIKCLKI